MKRRKFIKRSILAGLGLATLPTVYAWQIEPFWLEFVHKKMPIANLPSQLEGKSLMHISDVHVGNRVDCDYLIDSFKKAQAYKPDFVVYSGDFVHYQSPKQYNQLDMVFKHAVKGKLGTAGVLGNHDYGEDWSDLKIASKITKQLQESGIKMLSNSQIAFNGLNVIGIDDLWSPNFAPDKVMKQYDAKGANVVLCHNPDVCDLDVWHGYKGWILSGHTHGGQCKPPFLKAPMLPVENKKYDQGEIDLEDGRTLYINRALGHLFQVRFNVRPEITIFELRAARP